MHTKSRKTKLVISIVILTLAFTIYNIYSTNTTFAESSPDSFTITAEKSLTVTVPYTTNLSIHPTENGAFNTADINIIVNSNNRYGYNLNMTTATTSLTGNAPLSSGNYPVIESISSSGMTCTAETGATCNFTKDKWGYKLSTDTTYSPIQANTNMLIKNNTNESTGTPETSTVTFGARLSNATPAGSYATTLTFIATINNPTAVGGVSFEEAFDFADKQKYNGYYAMQDMDATICEYVKTQSDTSDINTIEIGELIDKRDNEIYVVGKLADENCWMLDNLRLGGDSPIILHNTDTNITAESWTLPASAVAEDGQSCTDPQVNATIKNDTDTNYGKGSGKDGVYYNYCAVSAGERCTETNMDEGVLATDICPLNWRLISSGGYTAGLDVDWRETDEIYKMFSLYPSPEVTRDALSATLSGAFHPNAKAFISRGSAFMSNSGQFRPGDVVYTIEWNTTSGWILGNWWYSWLLRTARCVVK
ncbi:hypothetical protein IKG68_01690 [Candidatus Saccharibacteria bacterium]|nr:hypothetical protein [Candidatus Saccharibacteria bacterium]